MPNPRRPFRPQLAGRDHAHHWRLMVALAILFWIGASALLHDLLEDVLLSFIMGSLFVAAAAGLLSATLSGGHRAR